jgi:signal transduction histidine kinase
MTFPVKAAANVMPAGTRRQLLTILALFSADRSGMPVALTVSPVAQVVPWVGKVMSSAMSTRTVPVRALTLSLMALTAAVGASVVWPDAVFNQQVVASGLALIPAFLLAYYRRWAGVEVLLGAGMVTLALLHLFASLWGLSFGTFPLGLCLTAPYIAIALGAGWFGEIRRSAASLLATQMQLIQSAKLESMGRLAAGVAHEVKNPLMTILTGIKVLSKRLTPADERTQLLLQDMVEAVTRADTIIGGMLSYSRQRELKPVPVDVNTTIERSLVLVKHELDTRQITVVRDLKASLPLVRLDEFKIQQVFIDLFTNALQSMGQAGTLTLRTLLTSPPRSRDVRYRGPEGFRPGQRVVVVQVDDTGSGVRPEHLGRVFDPFFTTKASGIGTGLGLSVSRQIVELHGGAIAIANRDAGGARVTMTFPLGTEDART